MNRSFSFRFISLAVTLLLSACGASTNTPAPTNTAVVTSARVATSTSAPAQAAATSVLPSPTSVPPTAVPTSTSTRVPPTATPTSTSTRVPPTPTPSTTTIPSTLTTAPTMTVTASANGDALKLELVPLVTDLKRPTFITGANDGSNRLFFIEQQGRIYYVDAGSDRKHLFLDIRDVVNDTGNEQGLLGLAFHPDFKNNGLFFIDYSNAAGDNVLARYHVSADPTQADAASAKILLTIPGLEPNHNGGMLAFGPDGYLYIGTGDGGGGGDRHGTIGNGQNRNTLLGKILRLDVNGDAYRVPDDNPFVNDANALPEIWAYGFRNPWRFSFDRAAGDLYIADVGQGSYEEIDFQPASSKGGENYGWRIMEGAHCYNPKENCDTSGSVEPIFDYTHDLGCSVTGGYVYRGVKFPSLVGQYLFADYCTGVVWATSRAPNGTWNTRQVARFDDTISSFGQDDAGELYVAGHRSGTIYKLILNP